MIHRDKPQRMLELSLVSMFSALLMSQLQQPSPMDWTRKIKVSAMSSFSTWVVVLSMSLFSALRMEFSKSRPPMDTLTWVERTSTMFSLTIASPNSRNLLVLTSLETQEP